MLLNELQPGLVYLCVQEGPPVFTMEVSVNGNSYQGFGKSKKLGKVGAAIKALRNEFKITISAPDQEIIPSNTDDGGPIQISGVSLLIYGIFICSVFFFKVWLEEP